MESSLTNVSVVKRPSFSNREQGIIEDQIHQSHCRLLHGKGSGNTKEKQDVLALCQECFMFTTIRVISKHQDTQVYGTILPQHLNNQAMLESEAYMTYQSYATGEKTPKPKSTKKKADFESSPKTKLTQASKGKRIKTIAKGDKPAKKKQSVTKLKGLTMLSEVALTEVEQIKLATKRSLIQTHNSHASGSGADEGTGIPGVPDVPTYESDDEQISWKSSEDDDDDEVNVSEDNDDDVDKNDEDDDADNQDDEIPDDDDEQTDSDNDGDDFVHPKLSNHDDEARKDDEVNEEESDDESNEDSDEEIQGENLEEEEMDEEATHEEGEANELYRDVNINLEGRDTVMTDAPLPNSSSVSSGFISNMLNPSPDTGIDTIFTPNTKATSLVDVSVTTTAKPPLLSATTLSPTPLITHLQQTPVPTPATVLSSSLQDLPNFGSLFAVSSIPGIVDAYLANKIHEAVKTDVQLQFKRLRDEAQAENADFLNKLDNNIKKIIKDQVKEQVKAQVSKILTKIEKTVNEQLEAEVMTRSSTESKTSLSIAANLSELELKKILIDKMESNKHKDDKDKDEEPSAGSNRALKEKTSKTSGKSYEGSKSKHKTANKTAQTEEPMHTTKDLEELAHQEFETGVTKDQPNEETPSQQYPHDLRKPLPLIPNYRGRHVIPFDQFINNDLEYLSGGISSRKYATSMTKTKAADYGHIKWIEDLVPNRMWSQVLVSYDKHALWGISHWGRKRQQFYGFAANRESARDVYSKRRIIAVTKLSICDLEQLRIQEHRRHALLLVQGKALGRSSIKCLKVTKELNLTTPNTYIPDHKRSERYNLKNFRTALNDRLKGIRMEYLPQTIWRQSDKDKAGAMIQAIDHS
ncbi:hypothetical protein Tco_0006778 [Tanacetum coccineum]